MYTPTGNISSIPAIIYGFQKSAFSAMTRAKPRDRLAVSHVSRKERAILIIPFPSLKKINSQPINRPINPRTKNEMDRTFSIPKVKPMQETEKGQVDKTKSPVPNNSFISFFIFTS